MTKDNNTGKTKGFFERGKAKFDAITVLPEHKSKHKRKPKNTDRIIYVTGYWNIPSTEIFERSCVVWGENSSKDSSCSQSPILPDEQVFFYFDHDQEILGKHLDFTITAYEEEDGYIPS